jgi:single-stranded-DNA-specific exonuclease
MFRRRVLCRRSCVPERCNRPHFGAEPPLAGFSGNSKDSPMRFSQRAKLISPAAFSDMPPFQARLFAARTSDARKPESLAQMLAPESLMGISEAAQLMQAVIKQNGHIVIVADYDADGATGCALAVRGIRAMGGTASYVVPNRFTDGYGLSPSIVDRAADLKPALLVTVDNGIAAIDGVRAAHTLGIPVLVTDHHLPGAELPQAQAIVNPNQPGCEFLSKNLAGCGVIFYLLVAVRRLFREEGDPRGTAPLHELLDLLALGTVADVVRLDFNNRLLVRAGLDRIRAGMACPGINHLFSAAHRPSLHATSADLGFFIGPRINAAGRMEDAAVGIQCLLEDDPEKAARIAAELDATNRERRQVQNDIETAALALLPVNIDSDRYTIALAHEQWHEGVIGIVAGRLREKFNRPALVFAAGKEKGTLKGSGRSIQALHLRDCIDRVNKRYPGVIIRFGGHAMAAGMTIVADKFETFKHAFEDEARQLLTPSDLQVVVEHDGPLFGKDITLANADWIEREVWGQGFAPPAFVVPAKVLGQKVLKEAHLKLELDIDGCRVPAIWFGHTAPLHREVELLARLTVNDWDGHRSPQLQIEALLDQALF